MNEPNCIRIRVILSPSQFLERLFEEILGADNAWYAGEAVGHDPSIDECFDHYARHEGFADFCGRYCVRAPHELAVHRLAA